MSRAALERVKEALAHAERRGAVLVVDEMRDISMLDLRAVVAMAERAAELEQALNQLVTLSAAWPETTAGAQRYVCGHVDGIDGDVCERPVGHAGSHSNGRASWSVTVTPKRQSRRGRAK